MGTVIVSPKFQVVIPKDVCARLGLSPGHKIPFIADGDRNEFIPVLPINQFRGFFKPINSQVDRDGHRV